MSEAVANNQTSQTDGTPELKTGTEPGAPEPGSPPKVLKQLPAFLQQLLGLAQQTNRSTPDDFEFMELNAGEKAVEISYLCRPDCLQVHRSIFAAPSDRTAREMAIVRNGIIPLKLSAEELELVQQVYPGYTPAAPVELFQERVVLESNQPAT